MALNSMLTRVPLSDWKAYLRWHTLSDACAVAEQAVRRRRRSISAAGATGAKEQLPRWKRCLHAHSSAISARRWGRRTSRGRSRRRPRRARSRWCENMEAVLRERLATLDWMSDTTRKCARSHKLDAFVNKIGYPDKWRDYSALELERRSRSSSTRARERHSSSSDDLAKLGKPVDRTRVGDDAADGQRVLQPARNNEIVFPAGDSAATVLRPERGRRRELRGIGAAIGHEMTHGFDDQGRQFDAQGNLRDWWTPADSKAFDERARRWWRSSSTATRWRTRCT